MTPSFLELVDMPLNETLVEIGKKLRSGDAQEITARRLLEEYGAQRRSARIVREIRAHLQRHSLLTRPDFANAHIDLTLRLVEDDDPPPHVAHIRRLHARLVEGDRPTATVRELLSWFDAERRGSWIVEEIRCALDAFEMYTAPDFQETHIDSSIEFRLENARADTSELGADDVEEESPQRHHTPAPTLTNPPMQVIRMPSLTTTVGTGAATSPTEPLAAFKIGALREARRKVVSANPDTSLVEAVTMMGVNSVSHLPVLQGSRTCKGLVRWQDIAKHFVIGAGSREARVMTVARPAKEVSTATPLLDVIPDILKHGAVVVRDETQVITGIITKQDLGRQLEQLARPFVLLNEIELRVRSILEAGGLSASELADHVSPNDQRPVETVGDLTLGEMIRLLQRDDVWVRLRVTLDKKHFVHGLEQTRRVRNNIMHFDPESPTQDDLRTLDTFCQLLREVEEYSGE